MASVKTILFCLPLPILFFTFAHQSSAASLSLGNVEINFASLYNESDKIVLLNATNFKSTIVNKPHAWLIEFYSSWCGHCINFAPTWKELAKDVYGWRNIIQLAAIDCAVEENFPTCRDYEVMAYPSLKFFPPQVNDTFLGILWEGSKPKTKEGLTGGMIDFLEGQIEAGTITKPVLQPLDELDGLEDLWPRMASEEKVLLIFEEPGTGYWSREAILDLSASTNVPPIRRVSSHHEKLVKHFQVAKFPSLVLLGRNGHHQVYPLESPDRSILEHVIRDVLSQDLPSEERNLVLQNPSENSNPIQAGLSKTQRKIHDTVYMSDLEKAIHYSLTHEVAMHKVMIGAKLEALVNYVAILKKYFPARSPLQKFFNQLLNWLEQRPDEINGKEYHKFVSDLIQKHLRDWPKELSTWRGCKGSQPQFRGYPCGLWSLFHTLTVEGDLAPDPLEVLRGIRGYVATFFGCSECSKHFLAMAEEDKMESVATYEESVLWLWKAHNKANKRLARQPSEDPDYPKTEFPAPQSCPSCRTADGQFDRQEVVHFLRTMYGPNIDWTGVDNTEEFYRTIWKNKRYNKNKFGQLEPKTELRHWDTKRVFYPEEQETKKTGFWFGGAFSGLDISLCIVLYVVSCLVLVAVFSKIIFRRKYRRKTYAFDLFGKV